MNVLYILIKNRLPKWFKKNPIVYFLQETHFKCKDSDRLKVKVWRELYHANSN